MRNGRSLVASVDLFERQDLGPFDGDARRLRIEQAHELEQMTRSPGWATLEQLVGVELGAWERRILAGALEPDAYRHQTGYVRGLRTVLDTPHQFAKRVAQETAPTPEDE